MDEFVTEEKRNNMIKLSEEAIDCWKKMLDTITTERTNELIFWRAVDMVRAMARSFECMYELQNESLSLMSRVIGSGEGVYIPINCGGSVEIMDKIKSAVQEIIKDSDTRTLQ